MRRKQKQKKGEYSEAELVDLSRLYESLNIGNPAGPSSALARFLRRNAHLCWIHFSHAPSPFAVHHLYERVSSAHSESVVDIHEPTLLLVSEQHIFHFARSPALLQRC